ncbi:MAG TPA: GH116 family glycosyl-hydrolase [Microlunatus sp.]|nr:GH116 family glycosyl-hydrolase [Microlunatus sp.]
MAAFPLGGIGTGNVSVGARGELRDWEIANHADKGTWLPFTFFAIRARSTGGAAVSRVLESRIGPPHEGDSGHHIGKVAGLPRLRSSRMSGEYPLLTIEFDDDQLPVDVRLQAFTPLVPLDVDASSVPGAVLRYTVHNPTAEPVEVSVAGSMSSPVGIVDHNVFQMPVFDGRPSVAERRSEQLAGLEFGSDLPGDHPLAGTAALCTPTDPGATVTPQWAVDFWQDGVQLFWDDFTADGRLDPQPMTLEGGSELGRSPENLPKLRTGSVAVAATLAPGESRDFAFYLTWHTPRRPRAWNGMCGLPNDGADELIGNHYARRYVDAWHAAEQLHAALPELEAETRAFHDALYSSTLPAEVVDAVSSTLVVLRSTTCLLLDDGTPEGRFAAWEGSFDHAGSCEGTCTHVWGYAQTAAWLFPALERSARRTEFLGETLPDGRMRFRANSVFGNSPMEFHPAVDGQLASIIRLHREWRFSGDDEFLQAVWPGARRALEFAFTTWDSDGDNVLDSQQHNTYDIEFYGENTLSNSMFYAALLAGARLADHLSDAELAGRWRRAAEEGSARADAVLFNGEYYRQRTDDVDAHRYQYGEGCLSDQLLGQTHAHLNDLGHLFPADHVRRAIGAVFEHNFRRDFTDYHSVQRTYALNDDQGLVLCTWPRGGRPRIPFVYSDEVWSGIEYQVATNLIYEGLVDEGLEVVRAVRNRHDGIRRNPWNEAECGNHYARSLASWGVLIALTGAQWDAGTRVLRLAPRSAAVQGGAFQGLFTTAHGWGSCRVDRDGASLRLLGGTLELAEATITHPELGRHVLAEPVTLTAGQSVELSRAG